jgi:hypothetical protein
MLPCGRPSAGAWSAHRIHEGYEVARRTLVAFVFVVEDKGGI